MSESICVRKYVFTGGNTSVGGKRPLGWNRESSLVVRKVPVSKSWVGIPTREWRMLHAMKTEINPVMNDERHQSNLKQTNEGMSRTEIGGMCMNGDKLWDME